MRALTYAIAVIALCASTAITVAQIKGPTKWPEGGFLLPPQTIAAGQTAPLGVKAEDGFCWLSNFNKPKSDAAISVRVFVDGSDWKATASAGVTAQATCIQSRTSAGQ